MQLIKVGWRSCRLTAMSIRSAVSKFCSSTPLHGFVYTVDKPKPIAIVWGLLVAAAICLAVNDVFNLVSLYLSEPVAISIAIEPNDNLTTPIPTLCVRFLPSYYHKDRKNYENQPTTDQIENFVNKTDRANKLDLESVRFLNDNPNILFQSYLLLSYLTDAELNPLDEKLTLLSRFFQFYTHPERSNLRNILTYLPTLHGILVRHNVSLPNLKKLVGSAFCLRSFDNFAQFQYYTDDAKTILPLCEPRMITHMSFSLVCTNLFTNANVLHSNSAANSFAIFGTKSFQPALDNLALNPFNQYLYTNDSSILRLNVWQLDLQGRPFPTRDQNIDVVSWDSAKHVAFRIAVSQELNFYRSKVHKCNPRETLYQCQWRNRINFLYRNCGCWPTTLFSFVSNDKRPSCNEKILAEQSNNFTLSCGLDNQTLTDSCLLECKFISFAIDSRESSRRPTVAQRMSLANNINMTGSVEFMFRPTTKRTIFTQFPTKTSFISDLGGSIGSWLGASLIALIHLPVFMLQRMFGFIGRRRSSTTMQTAYN